MPEPDRSEFKRLLMEFGAVLSTIRDLSVDDDKEFGRLLYANANPEGERFTRLMLHITDTVLQTVQTSQTLNELALAHPLGLTWVLAKFALETGYMIGVASQYDDESKAAVKRMEEISDRLSTHVVDWAAEVSAGDDDPFTEFMQRPADEDEILN